MTMKIKGKTVNLCGTDYVIPPLSLSSLELMQDRLAQFDGANNIKNAGLVADVALAALKRNYPEMTRDQVADLIDLGNMVEVMEAVMNSSGLVPSGEAQGMASQ